MPQRTGPRRKRRARRDTGAQKAETRPPMPRLPLRTWRIWYRNPAIKNYREITANCLISSEDGRLVFIDNQATVIHMVAADEWAEVGIAEPFSQFIPVNAEQAQSILTEMKQTFEQGEPDADQPDAKQENHNDGKT